MIKLNNKNITYVALADSNNSVKGVKEIWYADSANSVKLVYRRKDALIEGEDYEKYHWLKTTEYAYINTKIKGNQDSNVEVIAIQYTQPTKSSLTFYGSVPSDVSKGISFNAGIASSQSRTTRFGDRLLTFSGFNLNQEYQVIQNKDALIVNGSTLSNIQATNDFESDEIYVFASNITVNLIQYINRELSIRKFVINDTINLIPCKLLKPIPKWLDANGIRRQVGECGMIDLVSGKFYGNVNSVGTFTVENYYERKEWLVGDGTAYIDTLHSASEDLDWATKVGNLTDGKALFWDRDGNGYSANKNVMIARTNDYRVGVRIANNSNEILLNPFTSSFTVQTNGETIIIDEQSYSVIKNAGFNRNIKLFQTLPFADTNGVKCAYFRFINNGNVVQNLIPCTLTMDLPASMDANNIARTKGTSGMWDLVSDRFYGNVANSGTFKAVNLAEGVDYEVHDWLQGRNGAYIDTNYYPIVGTDIFNVHFRYDGTKKNPDNWEQDVFGVSANNYRISAYINGSNYLSCNYFKINNSFPSTNKHYLEWIITDLCINGSNFQYTANDVNYAFSNNELQSFTFHIPLYIFNCNQANTNNYLHGDIAYFKITDTSSNTKMNLIPVKLLRSIHVKYDANGIARQAGECGMYDTVNDVFYGNVASSGTFSVEDDE